MRQGIPQIDSDDTVGVADQNLLPGAIARQQIERKSAVAAPVRVDRQAQIDELIDEPAQRHRGRDELLPGDGVVLCGLAADQ